MPIKNFHITPSTQVKPVKMENWDEIEIENLRSLISNTIGLLKEDRKDMEAYIFWDAPCFKENENKISHCESLLHYLDFGGEFCKANALNYAGFID